jgi:transketolase
VNNNLDPAIIKKLEYLSKEVRKKVVKMHVKGTNIGGAMSVTDILTSLYFFCMNFKSPDDKDRDRLILSKGHCVSAQYACLSLMGFIDDSELYTYLNDSSCLTGHPVLNKVPGIEASTGSLGHGLPIAAGIAHAARLDKKSFHTYVVLGDGECQEGSVWEGANLASRLNLDNLTLIVDANKIQAYDRVDEIMPLKSLNSKFKAFGFNTLETDGHDHNALISAFSADNIIKNKPRAVIAHTVKGKGVAEMENKIQWHYYSSPPEKLQAFISEIEAGLSSVK